MLPTKTRGTLCLLNNIPVYHLTFLKARVQVWVQLLTWDLGSGMMSFKFPRIVPTQRSEEVEGYMPLIENILKLNYPV